LSSDGGGEIDVALNGLAVIRTLLALCSGNHDIHYLSGQDHAQWMQGLRRKNVWIDGDSFWLCDYRLRCIGKCDPVPRKAKDDFWLMHAPPFGFRTSMVATTLSLRKGKASLRRRRAVVSATRAYRRQRRSHGKLQAVTRRRNVQ